MHIDQLDSRPHREAYSGAADVVEASVATDTGDLDLAIQRKAVRHA